MLDPYTELRLPNDDASFVDVEAAQEALRRHLKNRTALRRMQNEVDVVLRHQDWFESPYVHRLNEVNRKLSEEIDKVVAAARVCATTVTACADHSPEFPDVATLIPPRKAGADAGQGRFQGGIDW